MMVLTPTDQTVQRGEGHQAGRQQLRRRREHQGVGQGRRPRRGQPLRPRERSTSSRANRRSRVRSRSLRGGPPRSLDYAITVPKWMAITVSGTYADVTMDGVGGDVSVETTRGDIKVTRRLRGRLAEVDSGRGHAAEGEGPHRGPRGQRGHAPRRHQRRSLGRNDQRQHHPRPDRLGQRGPLHRQRQHLVRRPDQGQGPLPPDDAQRADRDGDARKGERDADGADLQRRLPVDVPDAGRHRRARASGSR